MAASSFEWPWEYNFPPFFTLQPNLDTREKQLQSWCSLILSYQKHIKSHTLDVVEMQTSSLFYNKSIERKLSLESIYLILDRLEKKGHIEWLDKSKKQCYLMWRTPQEWGNTIYKWAKEAGLVNTVCTFYELTDGDDTAGQEFHGLEPDLLVKALKVLESQGKAEIIEMDESRGVKFF
ncbi:vacuolar protein-sorting-associated protein 25 [Lingula anatina]|uniref:Vacuolar protein-sorting-associated protein 25 n=1 Tax=Lingula anatina TaxID=7574 RepID=A0A1S3IDI6_LINAN|nr:vacuolar protein-sorting-associated protein 25 [Lingula anatina]|eukprot:XP_013396325.1 vacuolar protein-sorting-associated protein 25 [Lingula anatina]